MKLGGALLLLLAGTALGFYRAGGLRRRVAEIIMLQNAFRLLETEVCCGLTPLPLAMEALAERLPELPRRFFVRVARGCGEERLPVFRAWEAGVALLRETGACGAEELAAVQSFGLGLGEGDRGSQEKNFQLLQRRLQYALEEAEHIQRQQGRLWRYLGICGSLAAAILLW